MGLCILFIPLIKEKSMILLRKIFYPGVSIEKEFDAMQLVKKYFMNVILSKSDNSIEEYLKSIENQGYSCLEATNKKRGVKKSMFLFP